VLTLERGLRNALANSGLALKDGWMMSSLNAARALGISHRKGSLEVGKDADLAVLNPDVSIWLTVAEGRVVYASNRN
jgi:N-acetylglucosamine-6-phosphate deacetylase